jgi:hypothetical protein
MANEYPFGLGENRTVGASIKKTAEGVYRLEIPPGPPRRYRLAQLDDYSFLRRNLFLWKAETRLSLQARVSHTCHAGTWGFGFWNDPFAMGFLTGLKGLRLPVFPDAAWFFYSSPESFLSLRDDLPGNGLTAGTFQSPGWSGLKLGLASLFLPFLLFQPFSCRLRKRIAKVLIQDTQSIPADPTKWHNYELHWKQVSTSFFIDGKLVLETSACPMGPLGFILWIDNQSAAWKPDGKIGYRLLPGEDRAWIEIKDILMR